MVALVAVAAGVAAFDVVAVAAILTVPAIFLLAPVLVMHDRIDLGFWMVDQQSEAWPLAILGAVLFLAGLAVLRVLVQAQLRLAHRLLGRWKTDAPADLPRANSAGVSPMATLTQREHEVLELMSAGLRNAAIAERLLVSEATVRKHIGRIFTKLDVSGPARDRRVAAVITYLQHAGAAPETPTHRPDDPDRR